MALSGVLPGEQQSDSKGIAGIRAFRGAQKALVSEQIGWPIRGFLLDLGQPLATSFTICNQSEQ